MKWWAILFIAFVVCPYTPPFSSFDLAGPQAPAADTHVGLAAPLPSHDAPVLAIRSAPTDVALALLEPAIAAAPVWRPSERQQPHAILRI